MFDPDSVQPYHQLTATDVNTADHQALTAALESMVLLKNDGALPFDKSKITSVALIGPNAQASSVMQGNYYGNTPYLVTPEQGFKQIHKDDVRQGFSGFDAACSAAQIAAATVLVVGLDQSQESEGKDRDCCFPWCTKCIDLKSSRLQQRTRGCCCDGWFRFICTQQSYQG